MKRQQCPDCGYRFRWRELLGQLLRPGRRGGALWSVSCPGCAAELKIATWRVWAIVLLAVIFGSQTASLTVLGDFGVVETLLIKVALIVGSYILAAIFLFKLEKV